MNTILIKKQSVGQVVILDLLLLGAAMLIPATSHLFAFPLYRLNPMLLILLAGMLVVQDRRNAFLLAVLLPMVSCLVTGMPSPMKAFCMGTELCTVVGVFTLLSKKATNHLTTFIVLMGAIVAGKVVFYLLKMLIIAPEVLIGTNLMLQICVALPLAALFAYFQTRRD